MNYPEAPRYIPATGDLLTGWYGPVVLAAGVFVSTPASQAVLLGPDVSYPGQWLLSRPEGWEVMNDTTWCLSAETADLLFDPMLPEVRDHLVRRLNLPAWMRDGMGLEPRQSAGLIACAAAGVTPALLLTEWHRWGRAEQARHVWAVDLQHRAVCWLNWSGAGWCFNPTWQGVLLEAVAIGPETGDAGKLAADTAALAHGVALMDGPDTLVLPWPGGPRVWRRV